MSFLWKVWLEEDLVIDNITVVKVVKVFAPKLTGNLKYIFNPKGEGIKFSGRPGASILLGDSATISRKMGWGIELGLNAEIPFDELVGMDVVVWGKRENLHTDSHSIDRDTFGLGFKFQVKI